MRIVLVQAGTRMRRCDSAAGVCRRRIEVPIFGISLFCFPYFHIFSYPAAFHATSAIPVTILVSTTNKFPASSGENGNQLANTHYQVVPRFPGIEFCWKRSTGEDRQFLLLLLYVLLFFSRGSGSHRPTETLNTISGSRSSRNGASGSQAVFGGDSCDFSGFMLYR